MQYLLFIIIIIILRNKKVKSGLLVNRTKEKELNDKLVATKYSLISEERTSIYLYY